MDASKVENWSKLQLLLQNACVSLRNLFINAFKKRFECDWSQGTTHLVMDHPEIRRLSVTQREKITEGDIGQWDITLLRNILMADNLLHLSRVQTEGIKQIVEVRNQMNHLPDRSVPDQHFNEWWGKIHQCLIEFDSMTEVDLEQMRVARRLCGVAFESTEEVVIEAATEEVAQLKIDGNNEFINGRYAQAVHIYSKALKSQGIISKDRAILHSSRCFARIKLFQTGHDDTCLKDAKQDAERCIELASSWWRGYFRLGQVYDAMKKFDNAEQYYRQSLTKDPQNEEFINDVISSVRNERGQHERMDYLDPRRIHMSTAEIVRYNKNKTRSAKSPNFQKMSEAMWLNSGNPELVSHEYCRLGHRCRAGLDGMPKSNQLAVEYYQRAADMDNAEGMYNLGQMLIDGEGIEQNIKLGIELLRKAAAQPITDCFGQPRRGVSDSEHKLGMCFEQGVGVAKDMCLAVHWYEKASFNSCSAAANNLGLIYESGVIDGRRNLVKAEQFFQLSARTGVNPDSNSMINLARIYEEKGDLVRALKYCQRAKKNGNIHPNLNLVTDRVEAKLNSFHRSCIPEWELENKRVVNDLTIKERIECFLCDKVPHFETVLCQANILMSDLQLPLPNTINNKSRFCLTELESSVKKSSYGKMLWTAKQHAEKALDLLYQIDFEKPSPTICEQFVKQVTAAARLETLVSTYPQFRSVEIIALLHSLLKEKVAYDEDVRLCHVVIEGLVSLEPTIAFLDQCIKDYPKNVYFLQWRAALHAFLGHYEEGLRDTHAALKLDPINVNSLFDRAAMMRLAGSNVNRKDAIKAYEQFLTLAPEDHCKVPASYYSIALLNIPEAEHYERWIESKNDESWKKVEDHLKEVRWFYDMGLAAEEKQLPFFLPYESNHKTVVESFLMLSRDGLGSSFSTLLTSSNTPKNLPSSASPNLEEILSDPNRILRLKQHREGLKRFTQIRSSCQDSSAWTVTPPLQQEISPLLADLKAITIRDMDPTTDYVHKGYALSVTVIDDICFTGSSICAVVQDVDGFVERCCIYNWVYMQDVVKTRETFGPGCKMTIINPYMRMADDGKPTIRVDDPTTIISDGVIPNMCRYCCKPNASLMCWLCGNARYCDYRCQISDWEQFAHYLICQPDLMGVFLDCGLFLFLLISYCLSLVGY